MGRRCIAASDEVICPATTCMATTNAICHAGAVPVFADIDPRTFNLDPAQTETVITPRTRAIMVVHQIGLPADIEAFEAIAARHGLCIVEDGATAFGARYRGQPVGARGNPTCYSFHPRKMITTGEGGMLMIAGAEKADRARVLRAAGASISDLERHKALGVLQQEYAEVGYNYRMTDMQAAMGVVQMKRLPEMLRQRAEQARTYTGRLSLLDEIAPPFVPEYADPCWSSYCITVRPAARHSRDQLIEAMAARGISCRRGIPPLYAEPYFRSRHPHLQLPAADSVAATTMFLPIFPGLTEGEQNRVIDALEQSLCAR